MINQCIPMVVAWLVVVVLRPQARAGPRPEVEDIWTGTEVVSELRVLFAQPGKPDMCISPMRSRMCDSRFSMLQGAEGVIHNKICLPTADPAEAEFIASRSSCYACMVLDVVYGVGTVHQPCLHSSAVCQ